MSTPRRTLRRSVGTAAATATSAGLAFAAIDYLGVVSILAYAPGATAAFAILVGGLIVVLVAAIFSELNGLYPSGGGYPALPRTRGRQPHGAVGDLHVHDHGSPRHRRRRLPDRRGRTSRAARAGALAYLWIVVLLGVALAANLRGVRMAGWVQTLVTYTVLVGTSVLSSWRSFHLAAPFTSPSTSSEGVVLGFQAIAFALFLYAAFEWVTTTAEEARTPRVITRALFIARC